jgi:hypothetical protein
MTLHHEDLWGSGGIAPPFMSLALDRDDVSASRAYSFTTRERTPGIHWIGGWVDPRVGLDVLVKRKILHCRELNLGHLTHSPSLYRLRYADSSSRI